MGFFKLSTVKIELIIIFNLVLIALLVTAYYSSEYELRKDAESLFSSLTTTSTPTPPTNEMAPSIRGVLSKNPIVEGEQVTISLTVSPPPPSIEGYTIDIDYIDPDLNFVHEATVMTDSNGKASYKMRLDSGIGIYEIILTHLPETPDYSSEFYGDSYQILNLTVE